MATMRVWRSRLLSAGCAAALLGPPALAFAGDRAGVIKHVVGQVVLQRGQTERPAAAGTLIQVGDILRSGPASSASITLSDDTLISTGPVSELVISEFAYDPTTQQGGMLLSLWRGVMAVVTGAVAKRQPDNVTVRTRTVVLGVRGTEFIVDAAAAERRW